MSLLLLESSQQIPEEWFKTSLNPYRLPGWDQDVAAAIYRRKSTRGALVGWQDEGRLRCVLSLTPLEWDYRLLGLKVAALGALLGDPSFAPSLLSELLPTAREMGYLHLSTRQSPEHALLFEDAGFQCVGEMRTYVLEIRRASALHEFRKRHKTRSFRAADKDAVKTIARTLLATVPSRLRRDAFFAESVPDLVYDRWLEELMHEDSGNLIQVVLSARGEIEGFLACRQDAEAAAEGQIVFGRGLACITDQARGAYFDLLRDISRAALQRWPEVAGFFEIDRENKAVTRVLDSLPVSGTYDETSYSLAL